MASVEKRKDALQKGSARNIASLFTTWEIPQFPKSLPAAIARAERRELVRHQLHKLQAKPARGALGSAGSRQKYSRALGQIGYEQLPLLPLRDIPEIESLSIRMVLRSNRAYKRLAAYLNTSSLRETMRLIVADIDKIPWLSEPERQQMVNTFITDIASRYNQIQDMMQLRGTPRENRELIIKILERFRLITASILEMLRHRKQKMERLGIFEGDTNCGRLRTVFLTELRRRIDTTKLVKHAIIELRGGISTKRAVSAAKTDVALSELQEMKQTLDRIARPMPHLTAPIVTGHDKNSKRGVDGVEHAESSAQSHIRFEKILAAKQQERELALKAVWQQHKLISEDLISLLRKPRDSDEPDTAVADEGELWEDVDENEYEEQARMELEYNDADIQVMAINATDDPILQAHTEVSLFTRRERTPLMPSAPKRYLQTKFRHARSSVLVKGFDLNALEQVQLAPDTSRLRDKLPAFLSPHSHIAESKVDEVITQIELAWLTSVRSFNSRVSMRVPKDFISLAAEPTSGAGEFNSEVDNRVLNVLDEKLARYKEVEELYDEIMKTVRGSHMETDEDEDLVFACPAAPLDPQIPLTDTYLGVKSVVKPRKKKKWLAKGPTDVGSKSDAESPTGGRRTPTIMLTTRAQRQGAQVHADEFILDRVAAMKKTQSSKYTMRYNFGGYIPTQVAEERRKPREEFGASDYSDYLRGKMCDFLSNMIFQDDDQEDTESESEEIASTLSAEERRKAIEEAERKRKERLERLFDFKKDMWNSEVLDYISEISRAPEPAPAAIRLDVPEAIPEEPDEPTQLAGNHGSESEMTYPNSASQEAPANESAAPAGEHGTQIRQPSNIEVLAAKARKISVEAAHESKKIHDPQAELEALWVVLKMPLDQKLDMAIKYGSHKFTKLSTAIRLWKTASENIMLREKLMSQLEDFEMTASDPARFFSKGYAGSSAARLKEAEKREELMRQLHSLEAKISSIASHIKYELRETVTFDGAPYLEKMKTDYSEIIKRCAKARAEQASRQPPLALQQQAHAKPLPSPPPPPPLPLPSLLPPSASRQSAPRHQQQGTSPVTPSPPPRQH